MAGQTVKVQLSDKARSSLTSLITDLFGIRPCEERSIFTDILKTEIDQETEMPLEVAVALVCRTSAFKFRTVSSSIPRIVIARCVWGIYKFPFNLLNSQLAICDQVPPFIRRAEKHCLPIIGPNTVTGHFLAMEGVAPSSIHLSDKYCHASGERIRDIDKLVREYGLSPSQLNLQSISSLFREIQETKQVAQ